MAKFFRVLSVLALAYFCTPTAAQAIPITIDFSGTLTQAMAGGCAYCGAYTATFFSTLRTGYFSKPVRTAIISYRRTILVISSHSSPTGYRSMPMVVGIKLL
jgi:hypothetical protein